MRNLRKSLFGLLTGVVTFVGLTGVVAAQGYDYYGANYDAGAGAFGFVFFLYCCFGLIALLLQVLLSYLLYKDAEAKKIDSAIVWAILYFFFNGLALAAYFYFNRDWTKRFGITSKGKDFVEKAVDDVKEKVEDMKEKAEKKD